jgi:inner membrane protein
MDLLSHGLLGAATAQAAAGKGEIRIASGVGAASALLADADAFIRSSADPLLYIEFHRHFTHSLLFIPIGAAIAAMLLWPLLRHRLSFARLYLFAFLGYGLAGLLDACTSYGTHLLWPFSDARTAWSIISVLDPAFWVLLAVHVVTGFLRREPRAGRIGLVLAGLYLALGTVQHQRALAEARAMAAERGHVPERATVKPTMANLLLWRSIYVTDDVVHVDAVRVGLWSGRQRYPGGQAPLVRPSDMNDAAPAGSRAYRDIERFSYFSDDLLTRSPEDPWVLGDARYAMLPNELTSLWSIRVDPARPEVAGLAFSAAIVYLVIYGLMDAGAFGAAVAFRERGGGYFINDYAGLWTRSPALALMMAGFMVSLAGAPPVAGFWAKLFVFQVTMDANVYWLAVVMAINVVIAAWYYLLVVKKMFLEAPEDETTFEVSPLLRVATGVAAVALVVAFLYPRLITDVAERSAEFFALR